MLFNAKTFTTKLANRNKIEKIVTEAQYSGAIFGQENIVRFEIKEIPVEEVKEYLDAHGLTFVECENNVYSARMSEYYAKMFDYRVAVEMEIEDKLNKAIQLGRSSVSIEIRDYKDRKFIMEQVLEPKGFKVYNHCDTVHINF